MRSCSRCGARLARAPSGPPIPPCRRRPAGFCMVRIRPTRFNCERCVMCVARRFASPRCDSNLLLHVSVRSSACCAHFCRFVRGGLPRTCVRCVIDCARVLMRQRRRRCHPVHCMPPALPPLDWNPNSTSLRGTQRNLAANLGLLPQAQLERTMHSNCNRHQPTPALPLAAP